MHVEGGNSVTLGRKPDPEVGVSVKFPIESPHELDPPAERRWVRRSVQCLLDVSPIG